MLFLSYTTVFAGESGFGNITANDENATVLGFAGHQWVVIGYNGEGILSETGTMTLLADNGEARSFEQAAFNADNSNNQYAGSDLQKAMERAYDKALPKEKSMVIARSFEGGAADGDGSGKIAGAYVTDAGFWPLSVAEAEQLYKDGDKSIMKYSSGYWLRSPAETGNPSYPKAYHVYGDTVRKNIDITNELNIRPAVTINISDVMFLTPAKYGKSDTPSNSLSNMTYSYGPAAVMTVKDDVDLSISVADTSKINAKSADIIEIDYTDAKIGADHYVSAVICEKNSSTPMYHGCLMDCSEGNENGTISFGIPEELETGSYTLKIFNEQINDENFIDFACTPVEIELNVTKAFKIDGYVGNESYETCTGAVVALDNGITAVTNENGYFEFTDRVENGTYKLTVEADGYETFTKEIVI